MSALPPKADMCGRIVRFVAISGHRLLIRLSHQRSVGDAAVITAQVYARDTYCSSIIGLLWRKPMRAFSQSPPNLCAPGTPEGLCCLSGGYESGVSILRRHRRGRFDIRQAASRGSGEDRSSRSLIIGELTNNQPVVAAEGQVPFDELASDTLEEFGNGFLAI